MAAERRTSTAYAMSREISAGDPGALPGTWSPPTIQRSNSRSRRGSWEQARALNPELVWLEAVVQGASGLLDFPTWTRIDSAPAHAKPPPAGWCGAHPRPRACAPPR